jgi:hypothetical protein
VLEFKLNFDIYRMKKYSVGLLFFFLQHLLLAGNRTVDSLKTVIKTTTEDTIKVQALNKLTDVL